ncbi:hypothetical protein R1flu_013381 [Riccia fluitans]|uniref:Uncharacterized protein n=1 Tax=Riccia fluitans TaxID=41844 RepID=A0ABD1YDF3_9MARC
MAPCSGKDLKVKTKEVKIPNLTNVNKKKMESWGLGGLFAVDLSQTYEDLVEELAHHSDQKVAFPKFEYHEKPGAWTSDVWREVYNMPKVSPGGYVMKGKVQFTELQLFRLVKGDKWQTNPGEEGDDSTRTDGDHRPAACGRRPEGKEGQKGKGTEDEDAVAAEALPG